MTDEESPQDGTPRRWGFNADAEQAPPADEAPQYSPPPPARPAEPPVLPPEATPTVISPGPAAPVPPAATPPAPTPPAATPPAPTPPAATPPQVPLAEDPVQSAPLTPPWAPLSADPAPQAPLSAEPVAPAPTPQAPITPPPAEAPITQAPVPPVFGATPAAPPLGQNIGATPPPVIDTGEATVVASGSASPVLAGDYGITPPPVAPDAPSSSSKLPWVVAVAGALVLLLGGGFFALNALGASGGAETPEAAVDAMIEALNNEDFITLGEIIEPSERRTIVEPTITEVLPELQRIGVFSDELDAGDVDGVDFEISDLTYRVEAVTGHDDLVHVYFTGGEAVTEFTAADFPFSDRFREEAGAELQDDRQQETITESETPLVVVQRDGRWYFSGWFTIAEAARLETDARLPLASEAPPALGSESPEAAVEAMIAEMVELDLAGMIGRMDPDEMAALYRYSPLFLEEGQNGLNEARQFLVDENISYDITDLDLEADTSGDDATVAVRGFTVNVSSPDFSLQVTYGRDDIDVQIDGGSAGSGSFIMTTTAINFEGIVDGENVTGNIMFDPDAGRLSGTAEGAGELVTGELTLDPEGVCSQYNVNVNGETQTGCVEDEMDADEEAVIEFYDGLRDNWPTEFPGVSVKARQTDGQWYVSPIGTTFAAYLSVFEYIEDDAFDTWLETLEASNPMSSFDDAMLDDLGLGSDDPFSDDEFSVPALVDEAPGSDFLPEIYGYNLEPGGQVTDSLEVPEGGYVEVYVDLDAGDTFTATVQTDPNGGLDTTLSLTFNGAEVAYNDDAPVSAGLSSGLDSQIEITASESGQYVLEVGSYDFQSGGTAELELTRE